MKLQISFSFVLQLAVRGERRELRKELVRLAASQRGYFTASQAIEVGYTHQAQKFHVDHGNWERVGRGLFRLPGWPVAIDDHLVQWSLWGGPDVIVSHATALMIHDLGDIDSARIHLSVPRGFRRRPRENVVLHRQDVAEDDVEDRGGYRVTTPGRAIVECAADQMAQELLNGAVAEAVERGMTTRRMLRDAAVALGPRAELGIERALGEVA